MTLRPHLLTGFILLGLATLTAFGGLAYAWWRSKPMYFRQPLPLWRRLLASVGLLAVSIQALLFLLSWTQIGRDPVLLGYWARWVNPIFLIAAPCVLAGKGAVRWWLLCSSILLFVVCFFFTLSA